MRPRVGYVAEKWWKAHREQYTVDGGNHPWRLDPLSAAQSESVARLGFHHTDSFFLQGLYRDALSGLPHALVKVLHADSLFLLELCQPVRQGAGGIWTVERVNEMRTDTVAEQQDGPCTGYVWFADEDHLYGQLILNEGHNPWRLDPLEAARLTTAGRLGFQEADRFFWRGEYKETASGRQKAVVWAVHGLRVFHMELYQPAQQGAGGIWAVEHVLELLTEWGV